MARVPTSGRKSSYREDDEDDELGGDTLEKLKKANSNNLKGARATFAKHLLETADAPALGRPPKTDEEKQEVYRKLAILRSIPGKSYEDCAEALGVSRSTIGLYLRDPYYKDICDELYQEGKRQGFVSASMLVGDSFAMLYQLMQSDPSGFVRMSCAKILLEHAGLTQPMTAMVQDDVKEVNKFLELARQRGGQQPAQVNVHVSIHQQDQSPTNPIIDALPATSLPTVENSAFESADLRQLAEQQAAMFAEYEQPLEPGGKLPGSESYLDKMKALQKLNES